MPFPEDFNSIQEKFEQEKLQEEKQKQDLQKHNQILDLEHKVKEFGRKTRAAQCCPYCFGTFRDLSTHRCSGMPSSFQMDPEKQNNEFFIRLYLTANVWDIRGFPFIKQSQQREYQKHFLEMI